MQIELYTPAMDDLWFREKLLGDPETMSYNRGCGLGISGYHDDTGCIDFPRESWPGWYARWVGAEPSRFYAYLRDADSGDFLGEVNLHETEGPGVYEMGIVVDSAQRGRGISRAGMALLLGHAFQALHARRVTNCFQPSRTAAMKIHLAAGFRVVREEDGLAYLAIENHEYKNNTLLERLG